MKNKLDSRDICLLEKQAAFTAIYKNMSAGRSDSVSYTHLEEQAIVGDGQVDVSGDNGGNGQ